MPHKIAVAACCRIIEHERTRLVRTPEGVWHLLRWEDCSFQPGRTHILDTFPVHNCPSCGAPLDGEALGLLAKQLQHLGHEAREEINALLAPTQPYQGGNAHINARLTDLGAKLPERTTPFRVPAALVQEGPPSYEKNAEEEPCGS